MAWHFRVYPFPSNFYVVRRKHGYVQDVGGSARYHGVSPAFFSEVITQGGDQLYVTDYYSGFVSRDIYARLTNKLNAKLVDVMQNNTSAQLLTSLVEVGESYEMIARRAISMRRAFTALRRFDLPRVAKELALPRDVQRNVERRVSKKHFVTQNWLEYWMGWAPFISDIQSAMKVLDQAPRPKQFRVTATNNYTYVAQGTVRAGADGRPWYSHYSKPSVRDRASFGGYARCVNPQLALASQLGLTNPFVTAWEVIPFSFIANWFVNVDQYLAACSPFYGMEFSDTYLNHKSQITAAEMKNSRWEWEDKWIQVDDTQSYNAMLFTRRQSSIPLASLVVELPDRLSLTRAATSVSLLTQLFLKP